MTDKDNPAPNPSFGVLNAVRNDDGSITTYDENGCWVTRYGGNDLWRSNNPGALKYPCNGAIGQDANGLAIFSSLQAGISELMQQITSASGTSLADRLNVVSNANGWGGITSIANYMFTYGGLDYRDPFPVPGTGINAGVDGPFPDHDHPGNSVIDPRSVILAGIQYQNGSAGNQSGSQTQQECPESGSGDGSGDDESSYQSYDEGSDQNSY